MPDLDNQNIEPYKHSRSLEAADIQTISTFIYYLYTIGDSYEFSNMIRSRRWESEYSTQRLNIEGLNEIEVIYLFGYVITGNWGENIKGERISIQNTREKGSYNEILKAINVLINEY